jgi:polyphosphate glucokinase
VTLKGRAKKRGSTGLSVLVIDIGGTAVKVLASGQETSRSFSSGPTLTPEKMVAQVTTIVADWPYDVVSIGYPGPVRDGNIVDDPRNLGPGWVGFDLQRAFGRPVRIMNDAAMQALGSYEGGTMLFLGLGTGLGAALNAKGVVVPLELNRLRYKKGTYGDYLGQRGLRRPGKKRWRRGVKRVADQFIRAFLPDDVVIGGGKVRKLKRIPNRSRAGSNQCAFRGGFRTWG